MQLVYVTACGLYLSVCHQKSENQNGILELLFRNLCGCLGLQVVVRCVMYVMVVAYPGVALWYYGIISLILIAFLVGFSFECFVAL